MKATPDQILSRHHARPSAERRGSQTYAPVEESAFHRVLRAKTNVQAEKRSRSAIVRISSSPRSGRGAARRLSLGILGQIGRERTIFLRLKSREPLRQSLLDRREGVVAEHDPPRRTAMATIASRRYSSETISARPFCCHCGRSQDHGRAGIAESLKSFCNPRFPEQISDHLVIL